MGKIIRTKRSGSIIFLRVAENKNVDFIFLNLEMSPIIERAL